MGTPISLVDPNGAPTSVDSDDPRLPGMIAQGFHVEGGAARAAREQADARNAAIGPGEGLAHGFASGATLGGFDAGARIIGGEDTRRHLEQVREAQPVQEFVGNLAGAVVDPLGAVGAIGRGSMAIGEGLAGAGLAGRVIGHGLEGAALGAGQGVTELALSNDPLTAEHVASVLSSNVLLGGAVGGVAGAGSRLFERGLQLAGDKIAAAQGARAAVEGLPEDLSGLDAAGLKEAHASAKLTHAADIQAERDSLEALRANKRAEMANQVRDLHENLSTERPIYEALSSNDEITPALKGIDGVQDARVQLAKSYKSLRSALDSPISVQRDPYPLIRPLEQRQAALEALQQKLPEMHAAMAGDARAGVLEHIDTALEETKQQIATIRSLRETPVTSGRLTALEAGPSARMQAIDAARDALKNAPELGLVGKGASNAAFGGVTALAHMIPGVGIAAPFLGKAAADAVETLFRRGASTIGKVAQKAPGAASKFLGAAKALEPYATPTATKVLSTVRFGAGKAKDVAEDDIAGLFRARTSELYQQTMRQPDGTTVMRPEARAAMAAKLDPIRQVNPLLADKVEDTKARALAYIAHVAPKRPEAPALQIGPDTWKPSDMAIRAWARVVRAVEDPSSVEERLARGIVTPEEAQAYRAVYPARFEALQREIFAAAPQLEKTLPMSKKVALSIFTGIPVTPAMQPNVLAVLQGTFEVEPGTAGGTQAPRPQPNFGAFGSLRDVDKPTPAQKRDGG